METADTGNTVIVHYSVKDTDDQIFETSRGSSPFKFEIGSKSVMPRLDQEVRGMKVGDKKTFSVPPEEGYGMRQRDLIGTVKKSNLPQHMTPAIGQQVQLQLPDGGALDVTIANIEDGIVTLDGNHPLAGHTLEFEVEVVDIK